VRNKASRRNAAFAVRANWAGLMRLFTVLDGSADKLAYSKFSILVGPVFKGQRKAIQ
jgi:hypothetical protein